MTRTRIRRLGVLDLDRLPTCPTCPLGSRTWASAAQTEWGFCGVGVVHQDSIVAHLLLSPPLHVPRGGPQSGFGLNPDAAVLMSMRVLPEHGGGGLGRQLVQAAAARLARTSFDALEARGAYGTGSCAVPPVGFLEAVGFTIIQPHPTHPRLRLELSRTVAWLPDLRPALDRLVDWVRPLPPAPASRTEPTRSPRVIP